MISEVSFYLITLDQRCDGPSCSLPGWQLRVRLTVTRCLTYRDYRDYKEYNFKLTVAFRVKFKFKFKSESVTGTP